MTHVTRHACIQHPSCRADGADSHSRSLSAVPFASMMILVLLFSPPSSSWRSNIRSSSPPTTSGRTYHSYYNSSYRRCAKSEPHTHTRKHTHPYTHARTRRRHTYTAHATMSATQQYVVSCSSYVLPIVNSHSKSSSSMITGMDSIHTHTTHMH